MNPHALHLAPSPIPGYHSESAYEIQPEEAESILRVAAYHRQDFDRAVISFRFNEHINILTSTLPNSTTTADLGRLDELPIELLHKICLDLDVASVFRFRQTNTRARQVLSALHEYRTITKHAINPFCALLRTGLAAKVSLSDFYRLLCTQECSLCHGSHGDLVHLPLWIRCCSKCLDQNQQPIRMVALSAAKRILRLPNQSLAQRPSIKTLPGMYTSDDRDRARRYTLVPVTSVLSAYREEHPGHEAPGPIIAQFNTEPILAYMACCAMPSFDIQTGQVQNGVSCAGCQLLLEKGDTGTHMIWMSDVHDTVYSHAAFLEHFTRCAWAQRLWRGSHGGKRDSPEFPYLCKQGRLFKS
ncbi:hypothetical protein KC318_g5512 [Hortaea werneckii]|nr:hypothetical protein KC334_g6165 [Hortaea werneckii]KAI7003488.1 hypothetical protein KC355_g9184 [Hortaea werneckii]KAI7182908.1 hypothetical protein KC324_g8113 [Hortaea werneckii]KAI7582229.1 hypothetical protein KC316_g7994 [Hortaea werneckii]KAI7668031.1 hypothetical protein KC318_g5512 [Hortaea werneckii]